MGWRSGADRSIRVAHSSMAANWSESPFGRFLWTNFDSANPYIGPAVVRNDEEWIAGARFYVPIGETFGVSALGGAL